MQIRSFRKTNFGEEPVNCSTIGLLLLFVSVFNRWKTTCAACRVGFAEVRERLQIQEPAVGESIPLRNLLYVSDVVLCHVPDSLAQYQHDNLACAKADYVHFFFFLFSSHMCWFVYV